jgi:hypothetical protein
MRKAFSARSKQRLSEKSVIDHLAVRVFDRKPVSTARRFSDIDGRALQNAVGKEWSCSTGGGLPQF